MIRLTAITALIGLTFAASEAAARRYPISTSDSSGTWLGTRDRGLLHAQGELFSPYHAKNGLPSDRVNDIELSTRDVWVATPKGLARLDKGSRRWETFGPPELPSAEVTSVSIDASDPDQVWVGTLGGLARYNVRTNQWQRVAKGKLPSERVNDVYFRGRTAWVATDKGLAAYDLRLRTVRAYTSADGLAGDQVLEIEERGADLWLTCNAGLARMSLQRRTFVTLGKKQGLPGTRVLSWASLQNLLFIATDKGLITYDVSADSLAPFLYHSGLPSKAVRSVTTAGGFLWIATDKGLARFEPVKKAWEYYKVEDGLSSDDLTLLATAGSFLLVFGGGGELDSYDYKKDEWSERSELVARKVADAGTGASQPTTQATSTGDGAAAQKKPQKLTLSVSAELDTELKQDLTWAEGSPFEREGYWLVNTLRLGAGARFASGRKVDLSAKLDWGDISPVFDGAGSTLKSFQEYDFDLRYLGKGSDLLQEVRLGDELRLEPAFDGGRLTERTEIEGGRVVFAAGAKREDGRVVTLRAAAGIRRGTPARAVFARPGVASLQIKRFKLFKRDRDGAAQPVRQIIPSSVRALLDGRELERNVDYFVDHDNGMLWIKNTDLIHAMRVLEVEYEYEQIPRKNVGAVSVADLLPKDGDIGQLKRSGRARWARDEQGLFDEIDGGADQYINRGWVKTVSQDFDWSSAGIILRIHDMGDEKNASSIFLARKLPDAKEVPGLPGVFIERQTASIAIKLVSKALFIELSIDQGSMEQEILAIAGWLVSKLSVSGSTSADDLRDLTTAASFELRLTDRTRVDVSYLGTIRDNDEQIRRERGARRAAQDLVALSALHRHDLGGDFVLDARLQAAMTSRAHEGSDERLGGTALLGRLALTSPRLTLRAGARKYADDFAGIGIARQTEFCRAADGACRLPGQSRLDHEIGADATIRAVQWLPLSLWYQRQSSALGELEYSQAPKGRERVGLRDVASARLALDHRKMPKLAAEAGLIRRTDPFAQQLQLRAAGSLEADLGAGLLKSLDFKRIYLRGLYEYGDGDVDEHRLVAAEERDRRERMHHAVGELRLAPTLTENGYAKLEYHRLRGALDSNGAVVDQLMYWRLDAGAGSSIIPGLALRFDAALWLGDDQPLIGGIAPGAPALAAAGSDVESARGQEASSRLAGVIDLFFGEWIKPLSPLKFNGAYTFTRQSTAEARRPDGTAPFGEERCDIAGDEDGDGLADCTDPDCALTDICLQRTGKLESHRAYGTLTWDTPGKLQIELFGDLRLSYAERDNTLRGTRQELRSFVTWRPIPASPLTARFDVLRETKRPEQYDGIVPLVEPVTLQLEPAVEWRRRWSARWWHLVKLTLTHNQVRDLPHIRTIEDAFGRKGDLERLDYDDWAIKPSVEVRRRFEDPEGRWNARPYLRASYRYRHGRGLSSRTGSQPPCKTGDDCLADGSETGHQTTLALGVVWVHAENVFVDLDLSTSYNACVRAPTGAQCQDKLVFTPHLLATVRY